MLDYDIPKILYARSVSIHCISNKTKGDATFLKEDFLMSKVIPSGLKQEREDFYILKVLGRITKLVMVIELTSMIAYYF